MKDMSKDHQTESRSVGAGRRCRHQLLLLYKRHQGARRLPRSGKINLLRGSHVPAATLRCNLSAQQADA